MKRGEVNKAFQKRWFVLKGNLLFYFEKKGDKEPIGVIVLEGCTVELAESADAYTFEIGFQGRGSRTYVIAAESQEEMESWMKAVTCAGYDYMRLMVAELQRQLDEVNMDQNNFTSGWAKPKGKETDDLADCEKAGAARVRRTDDTGSKKTNSGIRQSKGQGMLVDLSIPDSDIQPTRPSARQNPFNDQDDGLELFGLAPFQPASDGPRRFEEMHAQFGKYIQKKMKQHSMAKHNP